jgi:hypothetical protein
MSQHDFNIANQSFPATRTDLNNALQALASNSSGDAEPSTTFANQWWYETDTNTLKLRNEANNAWLSFATVDQTTAAGCMWVWGRDRGGPAAAASWNANTEGRGSEYNAPNAVLFGGSWAYGSDSGSRCSGWFYAASALGLQRRFALCL